jgi:hypothetical protein
MLLIENIVTKKGDKLGDRKIKSVTPISADRIYEKILSGHDRERPLVGIQRIMLLLVRCVSRERRER